MIRQINQLKTTKKDSGTLKRYLRRQILALSYESGMWVCQKKSLGFSSSLFERWSTKELEKNWYLWEIRESILQSTRKSGHWREEFIMTVFNSKTVQNCLTFNSRLILHRGNVCDVYHKPRVSLLWNTLGKWPPQNYST